MQTGKFLLSITFVSWDSDESKSYGSIYEDIPYSVHQTNDNGYILAGYTSGFGAGNYDAYLIKTDSIGNIIWARTYGKSNNDYFRSVQLTSDGGFIASGGFDSPISLMTGNAYLVKTDSNGDTLWTKYYTVGDAWDVKQTVDLGYVFVGRIYSSSSDVSIVKTDSLGNVIWSNSFGGNKDEVGYSVWQTGDKGFIIAGETESFGAGNIDYYLIKTDSLGSTGACNEIPSSITTNTTNSVMGNGGAVIGSASLSNVSTTINKPPTVVTDTCFSNVGLIQLLKVTNSLTIYPNPFSWQTYIQTNYLFKNETLTIYNLHGETVKQIKNISGQTITLHRDNLPSGLYFIRLTQDNKVIATEKLVITD